MDKILETRESYPSGKIDFKAFRFQCDCLSAGDALDIEVTELGTDKKSFILQFDIRPQGFWGRLKSAWRLLNGSWCWNEFCVREEDAVNISRLFNPDVKFSDL